MSNAAAQLAARSEQLEADLLKTEKMVGCCLNLKEHFSVSRDLLPY